jgi:ferric-dicitrate binding protein FerR (iron transport regulator)
MKIPEQIYILLAKYISGEATREENKKVNAWLEEDESHLDVYLQLTSTLQKSGYLKNEGQSTQKAWKDIYSRVKAGKTITPGGSYNFKNIFTRPGVAAAVVFFILAMGWIVSRTIIFNEQYTTIENTAAPGQVEFAYLPDSSRVFLNNTSSIKYAPGYDDNERRVILSGEAFFEVKRDISRPFIVETNDTEVKVLGTSFNVSAYPENNFTRIIVTEGKVAITSSPGQRQGEILKRGMKATLEKSSKTIHTASLENYNEIAWKTKMLEFRETPLNIVIDHVNSAYQGNIQLEGEGLKNCKFTGSFNNQSLESIIDILSVAFSLKKESDKKSIILTGDGCT